MRDSEDNDEQLGGTIYTSVFNFESCFPFGRSKLIVSKVIIFVSKQKCIIKRKIQRHTYIVRHIVGTSDGITPLSQNFV